MSHPESHAGPRNTGTRCAPTATKAERDLVKLANNIRWLGYRLQRPGTVSHPLVKAALGQLDIQVASVLGQSQGRHRAKIHSADATTSPKLAVDS